MSVLKDTYQEPRDKVRMEMGMRVVPAAAGLVEALRTAQLPIVGRTEYGDRVHFKPVGVQ